MEEIIIKCIEPIPASRPRVTRWGGVHYGKKHTEFKKDIEKRFITKEVVGRKDLIKDIIEVEMELFIPLPKSMSKKKREELHLTYCDKNIDNDNLEKIIWDEILVGEFIEDDHLIVKNTTIKKWVNDCGSIHIKIKPIK